MNLLEMFKELKENVFDEKKLHSLTKNKKERRVI